MSAIGSRGRLFASQAAASCLRMASLAAVLTLAGCGASQPLGQVDGVVTLDGQPLGNVLVSFVPDASGQAAERSVGIADAAGRFELKTEGGRAGALVGTHRVVIEDLAIHDAPRDADGTILVMPPKRVPDLYGSALTSTATAQVGAGRQRIEVKLTSSP